MELDSLDYPLYRRVPDVLRLQAVPMARYRESCCVPFQYPEKVFNGGVESLEL